MHTVPDDDSRNHKQPILSVVRMPVTGDKTWSFEPAALALLAIDQQQFIIDVACILTCTIYSKHTFGCCKFDTTLRQSVPIVFFVKLSVLLLCEHACVWIRLNTNRSGCLWCLLCQCAIVCDVPDVLHLNLLYLLHKQTVIKVFWPGNSLSWADIWNKGFTVELTWLKKCNWEFV